MRFFYQHSPQKLESALSELVDEDLEVGLVFEQQIKSTASVPDALISQRPLELYFETKRGGDLDKDQIERHIASIQSEDRGGGRKILFGLTPTPISPTDASELTEKAKASHITFAAITFGDVVQALRGNCAPHETDLLDILNDYEEYLTEEELVQIGDDMTVVPCGTSLAENVKYALYFELPSRPSKSRSRFIGLYSSKKIQYICQLQTVIIGKPENGAFDVSSVELGKPSNEEIKRITEAINACSYYPGLKEDIMRYYLFSAVDRTEIHKVSKGGIWGARRFNLSEWLSYSDPNVEYDAKSTAEKLFDQSFK